jgi:hypothetical protein
MKRREVSEILVSSSRAQARIDDIASHLIESKQREVIDIYNSWKNSTKEQRKLLPSTDSVEIGGVKVWSDNLLEIEDKDDPDNKIKIMRPDLWKAARHIGESWVRSKRSIPRWIYSDETRATLHVLNVIGKHGHASLDQVFKLPGGASFACTIEGKRRTHTEMVWNSVNELLLDNIIRFSTREDRYGRTIEILRMV